MLLRPDVADTVGAMGLNLFAGGSAVYGAVYGVDGGGRAVGGAGFALGISVRDQDWAPVDECGGGAAGGAEGAGDYLHWGLRRRTGTGRSRGESAGGGGESGTAQRDAKPTELLLERGGGGLSIPGGGRGEESPDTGLSGIGGGVCACRGGGDRGDACVDCGTLFEEGARKAGPTIRFMQNAVVMLGALFFLYVGVENGFGGWVASYAKSLGNLTPAQAVMSPSFFYAALMLGRWAAPLALRSIDEVRLVQGGLLVACAGMAGLVFSHEWWGVVLSASVAGLGLACVYPITISLLSREFGAGAARLGSVMFTLSNIGGGLLPWVVGLSSNHFDSLKAGLAVPLIGCAAMFGVYLREWKGAEQLA